MKNRPMLNVVSLFLCLSVLLVSGCAAALSYPFTGKTVSTGAKVRDYPGTNGRVIYTLQPGEEIKVTSKTGEWYIVDLGRSRGYVHQNFLTVSASPRNPVAGELVLDPEYTAYHYSDYYQAIEVEKYASVDWRGANFRTVMDTAMPAAYVLHEKTTGYVFCLIPAGNEYWAVVLYNGEYGYVNANRLNLSGSW